MKLWLSKPTATGERVLVLDSTRREWDRIREPMRDVALQRQDRPLVRFKRNGTVQVLMPPRNLRRVLATFPYIELSPGIRRKVQRAEEFVLGPVPKLEIPGFSAKLYDYQSVAADLLIRDVSQILGDGLGLGKTLTGLAVIRHKRATPCLVICPNSAKWVWARHIEEYTDLTYSVVDGTKRERQIAIEKDAHFTIINFEALRLHPELAEYCWPGEVVDEFHRAKNPSAQVTQAMLGIESDYVLPISGTPVLNRPEEAWPTLHRLWPERFPDYNLFVQSLVAASTKTYSVAVAYNPDSFLALRKFLRKRMIRRTKDQVIKDLPSVIPMVRHIELYPEQKKLYRQIIQEGKVMLAEGGSRRITTIMAIRTRMQQTCFSPELYGGKAHSSKVDEVKALVAELVANGQKALIGSRWAKATRILQRELAEYNPAYVDGSVPVKKRVLEQDRFNGDDSCHLYIGTIGANREAISLGAATYVIITEREWSPMANEQFIGRSAAGGLRGLGATNVTVVDLYAHGTIEEELDLLLRGKTAMFEAFIEKGKSIRPERQVLSQITELFERA